jgi:hypothetical protein
VRLPRSTTALTAAPAIDAKALAAKAAAGEHVGVSLVELKQILGGPETANLSIDTRAADRELQARDFVYEHRLLASCIQPRDRRAAGHVDRLIGVDE